MDNQQNKPKPFPGFPPEPVKNYWEYPRIMNGYWSQLSGSEQKVLDYILRHTWGYKKTADFISYSQFIKGITKRDGTVVDRGCGIKSSKTLRKALLGLQKGGFVKVVRTAGRPLFYRLKICVEEVESKVQWEKVKSPMGESKEVGVGESKDTITDDTITDVQKHKNNDDSAESSSPSRVKRVDFRVKPDVYRLVISEYEKQKGIKLEGAEYGEVKRAIKTMLYSGRTKEQIIEFMTWVADTCKRMKEDEQLYKQFCWLENWTILTIKRKLPEFVAGKFQKVDDDIEVPSYAKPWQK